MAGVTLHQDQMECEREVLPKPCRTTSVRWDSACDATIAVGAEMFVGFSAGVLLHCPP